MLCSGLAMQMAQVAIGWQVYSIRHNAFDLGLIGLAEFVPVLLLALPAGQLADRLPRVGVVIVTSLGDAVVAGLLLVVTLHGAHQLWQFVALAALTGAIGALGSPAQRSLVPELVPAELLTARARAALDRRPGGDDRGAGARRLPLRGQAGGGLRRGCSDARRSRRSCSCR